MHQQNPIVINFEDIFKEEQPESQQSQLSTSLEHSISQPLTLANRNQCFTITQETPDVSQYTSRIKKSLNKGYQNTVSAPQQLQNLKRLIQQKQVSTFASKTPSVDIAKLTNKLYNLSQCNKEECIRHRSIKKMKDLEESLPFYKQATKESKSKSSASPTKLNAFERLHNLSRVQQLKKMYHLETTEKTDKSLKKNASLVKSSHLKKYVPFYSRLQDEVNRSQQRIKIMQNNPQFATGSVQKFFKPRLIPNKYSQVSARYNENIKNNQLQNLMNSSLSSSFSSLDRSLDIVNRIQEHFYTKMKCIFANENEEWVSIDENVVKLLTEVQFKILQRFVIEIVANPVKCSQFNEKLRNYYNNLPMDQKQALRNHETKETNKYREIKKKLSKDKKEPKPKPQTIVSVVNKKVKKPEGNYHSKIKAYI